MGKTQKRCVSLQQIMKPTLQLTQNHYESYMYHELVTCYSPLTGTREQNLLECHLVLDWLTVFAVPQFVSEEPFVAALIKEQFCHLVPLKSFFLNEDAVNNFSSK